MTRKDYILIAAALKDTLLINMPTQDFLDGARAAHRSAVKRVADALARDNARFDRARFLAAAAAIDSRGLGDVYCAERGVI